MLIDLILLLIPLVSFSLYVYVNQDVLVGIRKLLGISSASGATKTSGNSILSTISPVRLMMTAGLKPEQIIHSYLFSKIVLAVTAAFIYIELATAPGWPGASAAFSLGFFIIDVVIYLMAQKRKDRIERSLCFFIDHVTSLLTCGQTLERSLKISLDNALPADNPLRLEFKQAYREIDNGKNRDVAFQELADRAGVGELKTLAIVLNTSFKTGAGVVGTMLKHADIIRLRQQERSIKRINKKTVTAMIPLVLTNFPMFLLIVFFTPVFEMSKMFPQLNFW